MQLGAKRNIRRTIVLAVAAIMLICLVFLAEWIYRLLTSVTITIETGNTNAYVSITPVENGSLENNLSASNRQKLTKNVRYGSYVISVFSRSDHLSKDITVGHGTPRVYRLALNGLTAAMQPVYTATVNGVNPSGNDLLFINQSGQLDSITTNNNLNQLYSSSRLSEADWVRPNFGLLADTNNNLYLFNNGSIKQLSLPFAANPNTQQYFGLSPNGTVYLSNGGEELAGGGVLLVVVVLPGELH